MNLRTSISGSIVALVTPMQTSGSVDYGVLAELIEWHIAEGTDGIVSVGTTGESATLSVHEHLDVIARTVEAAAGRVPVIAGTGANSTDEAISLTREAQMMGVDACLSVTPYYNKPPQEGLFRHYAAVAEAVDVPLILYNVPGRTGCDLLPQTVKRLLQFPNIVAIKEAVASMARVAQLIALDPRFVVLSGDDATARETMLMGGRGDISVTANVAPRLMHDMCKAAIAGDRATAEAVDVQLQALHRDLFCEPNPIPVKWALARMGKTSDGIRLPLVPMNSQHAEALEVALVQAGIKL